MNSKNIIFDNTIDEYGRFQSGYRVYRGTKYITVEYLTNYTGQYDKTYRLTLAEWEDETKDCDIIDALLRIDYNYTPIKTKKVE